MGKFLEEVAGKTIGKTLGILMGLALVELLYAPGEKFAEKVYNHFTDIHPEKCTYWMQVDTHADKKGLWRFYTHEEIKHNTRNWKLYQEGITVMNNGRTTGHVLVPDLDRDYDTGK